MSDTQVARTILAQLGGGRFAAMTGAKHFGAAENELRFQLPPNFAKDGINFVTVHLDASDTYTVRFAKVNFKTLDVKLVAEVSDVYCDMLREIFESHTGLYTSLGRVVGVHRTEYRPGV